MITVGTVKLEGIEELTAMLRVALVYHKENDVRKALAKGGKVIITEAQNNVVVDTGNLKASIKQLPKFRGDPWAVYVGPRIRRTTRREARRMAKSVGVGVDAKYANFVEYGTDPHDLSYDGKFISEAKGTRGKHPGAKAKPFMRPAYDTKGQEALNVSMEAVWKMIEDKVSHGHIDMMVANKKGGKRLF